MQNQRKRLIDGDRLLEKMLHPQIEINDGQDFADWYMQCVEDAPAVDAEPVRHGQWNTVYLYGVECHECSACSSQHHAYTTQKSRYCPFCGAKMD